jgi:hypothetical protein
MATMESPASCASPFFCRWKWSVSNQKREIIELRMALGQGASHLRTL